MRRRSVSSFVSPGPLRADAAAEPRQRRAGADEPRQQVLQLRELDLQLAFARAGAPRKDVEDELRAIDDLSADLFLDLPQLRRRQLVVEDRPRRRASPSHDCASMATLPGSQKRRRVRLGTLLHHAQHDLGARGLAPIPRARRASVRHRVDARVPTRGRRGRPVRAQLTSAKACGDCLPRHGAGSDESHFRHVDDGRREAPGCAAAVDEHIEPGPTDWATASGIIRGRLAAPVCARRRQERAGPRAERAGDTACAGTRTPTRPVPAVTSVASLVGAGAQQRERARPECGTPGHVQRPDSGPTSASTCAVSAATSGSGCPAIRPFSANNRRTAVWLERIGRDTVQRVGRDTDEAATPNRVGRLFQSTNVPARPGSTFSLVTLRTRIGHPSPYREREDRHDHDVDHEHHTHAGRRR